MPAEKYGVQVVSIGFMTKDDDAIIWRGPMLHGAIQQFFREVAWQDLDYLIIDMPPGTGDVALSLSQTVPVVGAVVVTTPQQVSLADSRRAVRMYQKLNIPTLGLVENMSYYSLHQLPSRGRHLRAWRRRAAGDGLRVPFLGRLPIYQPIREGSDSGCSAGRGGAGVGGGARVPDRRRADGRAGVDAPRSKRPAARFR